MILYPQDRQCPFTQKLEVRFTNKDRNHREENRHLLRNTLR